jgi:site-specific recombinase XerC
LGEASRQATGDVDASRPGDLTAYRLAQLLGQHNQLGSENSVLCRHVEETALHRFEGVADDVDDIEFDGEQRALARLEQKNAAITAEVRAMVETLSPTSLLGVRDRALLLVGFAGAFRRSELVSLDVAEVTFGADSLVLQLRRSKTDQEGEGRKVGLPFGSNPLTCPVRALRDWLDVAVIAGDRSSAPSIATATSRSPG